LSNIPYSPAPGRLEIETDLKLSSITTNQQEDVTTVFTIKNIGGQDINIQALGVGVRLGVDWTGAGFDYPGVSNINLQPNQPYTYHGTRSFSFGGSYFAEPVVKIRGNWGSIPNFSRIYFNVINSK